MQIVRIGDHTVVTDRLGAHSVVIDAGANDGEFARAIIDRFGCLLHAIEPVSELFDNLPALSKMRRYRLALSGSPGETTINVLDSRCATMLRSLEGEVSRPERARGVTVAAFLERNRIDQVDLMKMDIEGAEVEVLETASDETLRRIHQFTIEFHGRIYPEHEPRIDAIKKRMKELGFFYANFSHFRDTDVVFLNRRIFQNSAVEFAWLKHVQFWTAGISRRLSRVRLDFVA